MTRAPKVEISEHDCAEHARGVPCGPRWYQFTAHNHTIGACSTIATELAENASYVPVKGPCTGKVRTDNKTGQIVLELLDGDGEVVKTMALDPQ